MHQRRSIRLGDYDYTQNGAYFVTICTHEKQCLFGTIDAGLMRVSIWGEVVEAEWTQTAVLRPDVTLDAFVIMPNHIHGILVIDAPPSVARSDMARHVPTGSPRQFAKPVARSLPTIVGAFKSAVTKRINRLREERTALWQSRYYEHIIRHQEDLNRIRAYIETNPQRWTEDSLYSD